MCFVTYFMLWMTCVHCNVQEKAYAIMGDSMVQFPQKSYFKNLKNVSSNFNSNSTHNWNWKLNSSFGYSRK